MVERLENVFDDINTLHRNGCTGELFTRLLKAKEIIDQLKAENADLKKEIVKLKTQMLPNEYESLTIEAIDEKQALDG